MCRRLCGEVMKRSFLRLNGFNSLLVLAIAVVMVMLWSVAAVAAPFSLYIIPHSGTNIPGDAGTTNLPAGNNDDLNVANGVYNTFLSTTAPTANTTRMEEAFSTANTWYSLGRAYYNPGLGSNATISANATGKFYLRSSNGADRFKFQLRDYNPAAGAGVTGTLIAESGEYTNASTSTTAKAFAVAFNNAAYTLPEGHYILVEIWFRPSANGRTGYVYCNDNTNTNDGTDPQSRINIEIKTSITSSAGANGSINPAGVADVDIYTNKTYAITAGSGYTIQSLSVDGVGVPGAVGQTSFNYTFSNITANHTISANFVIQQFTFNISPGWGGCIGLGSPFIDDPCHWSGGSTYSYINVAGLYTFVITPNAGYGIEWVRLDGVDQGVPAGQTTPFDITVDIAAVNTLSASFLPFHAVTSSAGTGGTIDPAGTTEVLQGGALTFDILPDPGYRILSITDNGTNVGSTSPYTITNITDDHEVIATFRAVYTLTATDSPGGSISPVGDTIVDEGDRKSVV